MRRIGKMREEFHFLCKKTLSGSIFAMMAISGGLLLQANPVRAVVVTVGETQYEISSFSGSFRTDSSKFATPPGGQMPWWGDSGLASTFLMRLLILRRATLS